MRSKLCTKCKIEKASKEFSIKNKSSDGFQSQCKECNKLSVKLWKFSNKDRERQNNLDWYSDNKEYQAKVSAIWYSKNSEKDKAKNKEWRSKNKDHISRTEKERRKNDTNFKIKTYLRTRIGNAIRNGCKGGSAVRDVGCSIDDLKKYLESKFQPGMTWDNWSRDEWHIDHVVPLCRFDLSDLEQFKIACHYSNLQPLWAKPNLSKNK